MFMLSAVNLPWSAQLADVQLPGLSSRGGRWWGWRRRRVRAFNCWSFHSPCAMLRSSATGA